MTEAERDAFRRKVNKSRSERLANMTPKQLAAYRAELNAKNTEKRNAVKDSVYAAYGGYRCACCGETEPKFLSIDHVYNDGAKHKRDNRLHTGEQLYRWLVRSKFPAGFQILCMNCQWGKRNNNGICPHSDKV